jgi:alpha,alpha-trehalase
MRTLVRRLADVCTVAIVSGRDRADAEHMVGLDSIVVAGSHGYDITGPGGLKHQHEAAVEALPDIDAAEGELNERLAGIDGARVERKRFAIAVHYREVESDADVTRIESHVDEVNAKHPSLRKMSGKKIFELQPDVEWDKGRAVLWLRETLGMSDPDVVTIYVGDDTTDEDAFRALRRRGVGIGIRVGDEADATEALYLLRDCEEVEEFLASLADLLSDGS